MSSLTNLQSHNR